MRTLKLFLVAAAAMLGLSASAQLTDGAVYWLQDASTGEFISQGASWGTQATVQEVGGLGLQAVYVSEGVYKLKNIMWNNGNSADLGLRTSDRFLDQAPGNVTLISSGNGYKLSTTDGGYISNNSESYTAQGVRRLGTTDDEASATVWKFLTKSEYEAAIQAYKDAKAATYATNLGYSASSVSELEAILATDYRGVDKTSSINNASLASSWDGWTHGGTDDSHRDEGPGIGNGCAEFWNGCGYATQTVNGLPTGLYKVEFVGTFRPKNANEANNIVSGETSSPAYVYANDAKIEFLHWIDVPAKANGRSGITKANGYGQSFYTYVSNGTLNLGVVQGCWENGYMWCPFGQFTLTYYSNEVSDDDIDALIATIPTRVSNKQAALLAAAKATLQANPTIPNYNALAAAIETAQTSANEYAIIDAGTVPTNDIAGWAISTTNGALDCNTWSNEGNSDGSGMTTPFIQDWVASGTALAGGNAGGKLYYTFTDLNPGETYVVTARIRVFNEAETGVTGAAYFVGSNTKSLETFGAACTGDYNTKGKFAVLSCAGTVDANGQLQFGIELDAASPINWMSIKDVTIAEGTGDVPTAIELNETSVSLTTGGSTTLTTTISPATADDKTILWTSSDETVATVSGGSVVAHKAGTATITATAYAGTNVTATCAITVANAAAPSFYSTEIADATDYYIMNAATGMFLGGANSWGTQASLIEHGIPFTATAGEGVYTLDSHTYNNANDHFFNGTYVDGGSTNLYISSLGEGKFSISTANGSAFVGAISGSTVVSNTTANADSPLAQWYFLSKKDRDKMLAAATANTPADATYYVKQANISRNLSAGAQNENAWSQYSVGGTQDNSNFAAQVYNEAVDNYQTIENIPNGTYTVSVQAFTSGTDVKFYANDQKVDVKPNDSGAASCSAAAALFAKGLYPNEVTVTVTDRTLKIGFEGDCSGAKWLCFDKVELYMTGYTASTGLTATIDKDELEAGTTATITAATNPANASFNAITYTSDNEEVATVDENGVVTGLSIGTANITVAATEMEEFTETIPVTVMATAPTALALSPTEVELDATTSTAELTITTTPAEANKSVTWTSSDETVATVVDGIVTAVSTGTATITATSTVDPEISAEATVTVTFPETDYATTGYTNDGATRTNYTLGENLNLIKNGAFEYPNTFFGWTVGTGAAMSADNFTLVTEEDNHYIKAKGHTGAGGANSISTGWTIEPGKSYVFGYKVKSTSAGDSEYHVVSLTNTLGEETNKVSENSTAVDTDWTEVKYIFTNTNYAYVQFRARWLNSAVSFDDFYLAEATTNVVGNVEYATAAIPTANIGESAFQYSLDAVTAANALVQGEATVEDVQNAYDAVTTLNVPDATQKYNLIVATEGHAKEGNAVIIVPGTAGNNNPTGYGLNANFAVNPNLNQAVTFTQVSGNNYNISFETAEGTTYLTYGTTNGSAAGWANSQIQATTDASKKGEFRIAATATDNVFNIYNTLTNSTIACQSGGNIYTENGNADFTVAEATAPSIAINTTAAGWGTTMLPFAVAQLPSDVKAYTCAAVNGTTLTLEEVEALEANKPYIIEGTWNETLTGDAQGAALTYTEGLLTGVYADTPAPVNTYVLQLLNDKIGFYKVVQETADDPVPTVGANHLYLTVSSAPAGVRAFFLDGETTGIDAIKALTNGEATIYNTNGVQIPQLQKGMNIIKMNDGRTMKVMVK